MVAIRLAAVPEKVVVAGAVKVPVRQSGLIVPGSVVQSPLPEPLRISVSAVDEPVKTP